MDGQPAHLVVDVVTEEEAAHRHEQAEEQQGMAGDAQKLRLRKVRHHEAGFAAVVDFDGGLRRGPVRLGAGRQDRDGAAGQRGCDENQPDKPEHPAGVALPVHTHGSFLFHLRRHAPRAPVSRPARGSRSTAGGMAMPPVRITRTPSSTERSGKNTAFLGTTTRSPRYRWLVGT